ncbi:MAG: metallophosphoesterase [Deltaproteobacteria bacterium]|nr:metallophosphoesterase [Deltaproteobacteria bacterium]
MTILNQPELMQRDAFRSVSIFNIVNSHNIAFFNFCLSFIRIIINMTTMAFLIVLLHSHLISRGIYFTGIPVALLLSGCIFDGSIVKAERPDTNSRTGTSSVLTFDPDTSPLPHRDSQTADSHAEETGMPETNTNSDSETLADSETATNTSTATAENTDGTNASDMDTDTNTGAGTEDGIATADYSTDITDDMWTFFSIADMQNSPSTGVNHVRSMALLDPDAVALFEVGDFTHYGTEDEWKDHMEALRIGAQKGGVPKNHFRTDATDFGDYTRVIGAVGNHELWFTDWYSLWNKFLPGQQHLGVNGENGVYFTLRYENALFIVLDSSHPSAAQTAWLEGVLTHPDNQSATWKIAFFHEPVYTCNSKSPLSGGLPWVALFEQHGVDLAVLGHAHTFERTCPMNSGTCAASGEHGVIYLTASGGGTSYQRSVYATSSGTVTHGERTDKYSCEEILADYQSTWHHFCHYAVGSCTLIVRCFDHDYWDGGLPRHQFKISNCF